VESEVRMMNRGAMVFLVALGFTCLLLGRQASGEVLFEEDFSGDLSDWYLIVYNNPFGSEEDPPAVIDPSVGQPAPSLNPNGNGWCGNGAYSQQTFDYSGGLIISWDMIVSEGYDWNWGMLGISDHQPNLSNPRGDGAYMDDGRCDPKYVVSVKLIDDADYNGRPPHLHFNMTADDGTSEGLAIDPANEFCNDWIHYEIEITEEGRVNFYMDDEPVFQSTKSIMNLGSLPILAGDRCYDAPVRIDNVRVESVESPEPDDDTDDDIDDDVADDDDAADDDVADDDTGGDGKLQEGSVGGCGCTS